MTTKARIVVCDDHPIFLAGLHNLIASEGDFDLVGEATNGIAALKLICEVQPDLAVMDISMPELNGIALARRLSNDAPSVKIMMLTLHEDRVFLKQALDAGVSGYLLKRSAGEILVQAVRAVLTGGLYVDPAMVDLVVEKRPKRRKFPNDQKAIPELTDREIEVLKLTALGNTSKEAARRIDVGVKSVETYKARGMEKLGLRSRTELVRYAAAQGWLANI